MKRRRSSDYTISHLSMLNEIDPGIDIEDSYMRMRENEAYVQTLVGTPTHRLYDIISSHEHWYVEGHDDSLSIDLDVKDDRLLELGFTHQGYTYRTTGVSMNNVALDIYRLRNHYHTRGMFLLPRDPYDGNVYMVVRDGYGYIE